MVTRVISEEAMKLGATFMLPWIHLVILGGIYYTLMLFTSNMMNSGRYVIDSKILPVASKSGYS